MEDVVRICNHLALSEVLWVDHGGLTGYYLARNTCLSIYCMGIGRQRETKSRVCPLAGDKENETKDRGDDKDRQWGRNKSDINKHFSNSHLHLQMR